MTATLVNFLLQACSRSMQVREALQMDEHPSGGWFFWVGALADGTFFHKERGVVRNWIPDFWTFWEAHGRGEEHKSVPNQKILLCSHWMLKSTVAWCDVEIKNLKCKASAPKMSKFQCKFDVSGLDWCTISYAHFSSWVLRNQRSRYLQGMSQLLEWFITTVSML